MQQRQHSRGQVKWFKDSRISAFQKWREKWRFLSFEEAGWVQSSLGCLREAVKMKVCSRKGSSDAEGKWLHLQVCTPASTGTNRLSHRAWEGLCTSSLHSTHQTIPFSHALSGRSKREPPAKYLSWGRAGEGMGHIAPGWGLPTECLQLPPAWNRGWLLLPSPVPSAPPAPSALLPTGQPQGWRHWVLARAPLPHSRTRHETTLFSPLHGTVAQRGEILHSPPPSSLAGSGSCEAPCPKPAKPHETHEKT